MTDAHLRRTIACPCAVCGAQPLKPCVTNDGKAGIFCLIPAGQSPPLDWTALAFAATELYVKSLAPIAMRLCCEACGQLHIDEGEFATKPHHTHSCQHCGLTWRPAVVHTVGVEFLPGFKNDPAWIATPSLSERLVSRGWGDQHGSEPTSEGLGSQLHSAPSVKARPVTPTAASVGAELDRKEFTSIDAVRKLLKLPEAATPQEILNRIHALQWDAYYAEEQLAKGRDP